MDKRTQTKTKEMKDYMHKRKSDKAGEIFVINVGGYAGDALNQRLSMLKQRGKVR